MKTFMWILTLCLVGAFSQAACAAVYIGGHADLGVGFENGGLHLHLHAEDTLSLFGGGSTPAGEYDPADLVIGVPGPASTRPAGNAWNFLAPNVNDAFWFLPQGSVSTKPFLGIGTEELTAATGWTTPLTWTFNSISVVSGQNSAFALWQNDAGGNPIVYASSLVPTATGNSWMQNAFSHDHFFYGFTGEGVYDVSLTIRGANSGVAPIAAGDYADTAIFRFATGNAIATVPEPGSIWLIGMAIAGCLLHRRRTKA